MATSQRRPGWTRADLVTVLAIFTVATAVFVPVLQQARGEADKVKCATNLRDLGVAAHRYHEDHGRLPPGYWGPYDPQTKKTDLPLDFKAQHVGLLPALLPYLGQEEFCKQLQFGKGETNAAYLDLDKTTAPWWSNDRLIHLSKAQVPFFLCPANPTFRPIKGYHVTFHLHERLFDGAHYSAETIGDLGRTHYLGVVGTGPSKHEYFDRYTGIFGNRSRLSLMEIAQKDGTGNTLMFGESLGGHLNVNLDYASAWMGCGAMTTFYGLGSGVPTPDNKHGFGLPAWYCFSSMHEKSVNFCFADGSVRGLRIGTTQAWLSPDWYILMQLTGWKDGRDDDTTILID